MSDKTASMLKRELILPDAILQNREYASLRRFYISIDEHFIVSNNTSKCHY